MINIRGILNERLQNLGKEISNKNIEKNRDRQLLAERIEKHSFTDALDEHRYSFKANESQTLLSAGGTRSTAQGKFSNVRKIVEEVGEGGEVESTAVNSVEGE